MNEQSDDKIQKFKHTSSSVQPRYSLIPKSSIDALAKRFQLGEEKYGDRAWSYLSKNQESLKDEEWIIARAEHIIHHTLTYIAKLKGLILDDGDDDAAAIMWGGCCLFEAKKLKDSPWIEFSRNANNK